VDGKERTALKTAQMVEQLELMGCIQCGKCTGGCPVARKTTLNIRSLIYHMLVEPELDVNEHPELWDCTSCFTCVERCLKDVHPAELIISLRGQLVESGRIPETIGAALMGVFRQGNPTGIAREDRAAWVNGGDPSDRLEIKAAQEGCETLYFVGCSPAYDPRIQVVTRALVKAFTAAGLDFGTLGTEENCCGNEVRRMGEVGLFEMLVEENGELFRSVGASQLVATSPHCFNTFKNEYGLDGIEILHYTQLIARLIEEGKLEFSRPPSRGRGGQEGGLIVTYHDPCFLGKQNHIFDEPRAILKAIPGVECGDGPQPGAQPVLRGRWRAYVGRGDQPGGAIGLPARARGGRDRGRNPGCGLPLLPADAGGRGQGAESR
jgi:Fe-S oxidoreductase